MNSVPSTSRRGLWLPPRTRSGSALVRLCLIGVLIVASTLLALVGSSSTASAQVTCSASMSVTNADDLDDAIDCFNNWTTPGEVRITIFTPTGSSTTIQHTSGTPAINNPDPAIDLIIEGDPFAALVTLRGPYDPGDPSSDIPGQVDLFTVDHANSHVEFSRLRLRSADASGIRVNAGQVTITDIDASTNQLAGLRFFGGTAEAFSLILANNTNGIYVQNATVEITDSQIANNNVNGVEAVVSSTLKMTDTSITGNTADGVKASSSAVSLTGMNISGNANGVNLTANAPVTARIEDSNIADNTLVGIRTRGTSPVVVLHSTIDSNTSHGLDIESPLDIGHSVVQDNNGEGVRAAGSSVVQVQNSEVVDNSVGVHALATSTVTVRRSAVHDNSFDGIVGEGTSNILVSNSTVHLNDGDGIWAAGSSQIDIANATITNNYRHGVNAAGGTIGGIWSSVIADNIVDDCSPSTVDPSTVDQGNNFASDNSCEFAPFVGSLTALADAGCDEPVGGSTSTRCVPSRLLNAGSNPINNGNCTNVPIVYLLGSLLVGGVDLEQRGGNTSTDPSSFPRTIGPFCDAGATETATNPCTASESNGEVSVDVATPDELDLAIVCYNTQLPVGNHTINLTANIDYDGPEPATGTGNFGATTIANTVNSNSLTIQSTPGQDFSIQRPLDGTEPFNIDGLIDLLRIENDGASVTIQNLGLSGADSDAIDVRSGAVVVTDATIHDNLLSGIQSLGGSTTVSDSSISNNGDKGIAVFDTSATVDVTNTTIDNNADGILGFEGTVTLTNSTVNNNGTTGVDVDRATVTITNSTIAFNNAAGIVTSGEPGKVALNNSTVVGSLIGLANEVPDEPTTTVASSIIEAFSTDCAGSVIDDGNNFVFGGGGFCGFTALIGQSVLALADNGCTQPCTQTIALTAEAEAIGGGRCTGLTDAGDAAYNVTTDQRGVARPAAPIACDAGAFEHPDNAGAGYVALSPVRIIDSRSDATLNVGPFNTPWAAGETRVIDATTALSGIPDTATAIAAHVTTVNGDAAFSWLTIYPTDDPNPPLDTASINYGTADLSTVITNDLIITAIDDAGNFSIYNQAGHSDLVIDVVGYYTPAPTADAAAYVPITPERIIDSRPQAALNVGPYNVQWAAAESRVINATTAANVPTGITAVAVHVTTVNADAGISWLTIYPTDDPNPPLDTASINYGTADVLTPITNDLVITAVDANGNFTIHNARGNVDVVIDIVGYYTTTDPDADTYTPITPERIIDSRPEAQLNVGPFNTPWATAESRQITASSATSVPPTATAVAVQITTIGATDPFSWLTTHPTGTVRPTAASINYGTATVTAPITNDLIITGLNNIDQFTIYNETGDTNVIIDVVGYYD